MQIRDATPEDAAAACDVLRRSISELCVADHRNDPAILGAWLGNKTPEVVAGWTRQKGNSLLVATEGNTILAVGSVTDAGEITLNYVAPEARFRGVSRAPAEGAGSQSGRTRQRALPADQHRDGASLLSVRGLHRRRAAGRQVRHQRELSDVQEFGRDLANDLTDRAS